jgi:hypothetical protein
MENFNCMEMRQRHLVQRMGEPNESYNQRLRMATLQNAFEAAIRSMAAKISDYQLQDPLEAISPYLDDVDCQGSNLETFVLSALSDALVVDSIVLIVDFNNELKRPYLTTIAVDALYCPLTLMENGRTFIQQVGVSFCKTVADGEFGQKEIEGIRVYRHRPATCQEYHNTEGEWTSVGEIQKFSNVKGVALEELPIVWLSLQGFPKLQAGAAWSLPLAQANFIHYNRESELDTAISITNLPTPYRIWPGAVPDATPGLNLGVNHCLELSNGMSIGYLEPSGGSLALSHARQQHREEQMTALGATFVSEGTNKTATQVIAESEDKRAGIDTIRTIVASAFQEAFKLWYEFSDPKYDRSSPNAQHPDLLVRDTKSIVSNASEVGATIEAFLGGMIPGAVAIKKLLRGGFFELDDFDFESDAAKSMMPGSLPEMKEMEEEEPEGEPDEPDEEITYRQGEEG